MYAGAGNDRVTVTNAGGGQVDCGDGNDTAVIVGDRTGSTNCEGPA